MRAEIAAKISDAKMAFEPERVNQSSSSNRDRLSEYFVDACEDLLIAFKGKTSFQFRSYEWVDITRLLDEEELEYSRWRNQLAQDVSAVFRNIQRSRWLYEKRKSHPGYQSIRKELLKIIRSEKDGENTDTEQVFWEIRQYVYRSMKGRDPIPGGPLELQRGGKV